MNRKSLSVLIVLNCALLLAVGIVTLSAPAQGQLGGLRATDYLMVAGKVLGKTGSVVYVTDMTNARMIAISYEQSRNQLEIIGARNLADDFKDVAGGR